MADDKRLTVEEARKHVLSQFIGEPHVVDALLAAVRAEHVITEQVAQVAHDFVRYYVDGTDGCRNCGGFPHTDTCFVGRFVLALALDSIQQPSDDTVTAARVAHLKEIDDCLERAFAQRGKGSGRIMETLNTLIAAAVAEAEAERDVLFEKLMVYDTASQNQKPR